MEKSIAGKKSVLGFSQKRLCVTSLCLLPLLGCETLNGTSGYNLSPASQKLRAESKYMSYVEACVTGSLGGMLIGALAGDSPEERKKLALQAGAAGCLLATGANAFLESNRQQFANDEERKQQAIETLQFENQRLAKLVNTSQLVVDENQQRLTFLKQERKAQRLSLEQAKQEVLKVDQEKQNLQNVLGNLRKREEGWIALLDQMRQSEQGNPQEIQALEKELASLRRQVKVMENNLMQLEEIRNEMLLG